MSENPTALDLIRERLKARGYDGLFNARSECACLLGDLAPCGEFYGDCIAGYRVNYKRGECPCGLDCDFHIVPEKPSKGTSLQESTDRFIYELVAACKHNNAVLFSRKDSIRLYVSAEIDVAGNGDPIWLDFIRASRDGAEIHGQFVSQFQVTENKPEASK